jgi:AcrR family transcriptional regulator
MDEIAAECGLAKGHIYHYFRSKEEIFTEIRIYVMTRIIEELTALAREAGDHPEAVLSKWISHLITRFARPEERYEPVMGGEESLSPENRKRIRTLSRRIEQMFATLLRQGMETKIFAAGDPKLTTFVILRAANTVTNWYREGGKWKLDWIAEQVTDQLLRSVLRTDRVRPSSPRKPA